jgi:iron(III) transport system substrate-binding protein
MHRKAMRLVAIVPVVVLAVAAASISALAKDPPPSPLKGVLAQVSGLSLQARAQKLYDIAKNQEGGEIVWYTSLDLPISTKVVAAFEAAYPGLKLSLYRATSETVDARVIAEASAGTAGADVIETNGPDMFFFQSHKDILVPYRGSPVAAQYPAKFRFDTWTSDRVNNFVIAWNTNLVPAGQEPKSFFDLADPKWKGKLSMETADVDWYAFTYNYYEQQLLSKLKKLKDPKQQAAQKAKVDANLDKIYDAIAQNSQIVSGHITQGNLLAAGNFAVVVSEYAHTLEAIQARGAPLGFKPFVGPVFVRPQGLGIAYRLKHPAGALLFYDWVLSKDGGQKAYIDNGATPAHPGIVDPQMAGSTRIPIDLRPIVKHWGEWAKRYDAVLH